GPAPAGALHGVQGRGDAPAPGRALPRGSGIDDAPALLHGDHAPRALRIRGAGAGAPRRDLRTLLRDLSDPLHRDVPAHFYALGLRGAVGGDLESSARRALHAE